MPSAMSIIEEAYPVEAMYGKLDDRSRREIGSLMHVAHIIREFDHLPLLAIRYLDDINEEDRALIVRVWQAVSPDRDIAADLDALRKEADEYDHACAKRATVHQADDLDVPLPF